MNLAKKIQANLKKFVPTALKRRFGHAASAGFQPHTRVLVRDDDGAMHPGIVVENLGGDCVRVELLDDGEIIDVVASSLRKAPRRRRASTQGPVAPVESEPDELTQDG